MKTNQIIIFSILALSLCFLGCGDDKKAGSANVQQTQTDNGHDHSGHSHAGHDHSGHDHSGHDHSGHNHAGHSHGDPVQNASAIKKGDRINYVDPAKLKGPIPRPCSLLTAKDVSDVTGVDLNGILLKEGSKPDPNASMRACFYKWDDPSFANAGLLVQAMKNPVPEEFDEWVIYYVDSKKSSGETSMDNPDQPERYVPYNDLGDAGAMSLKLKKFYWRIGNDLVFMIAYNMPASDKDIVKWTKELGKKMMENYGKS